MNLAIGIFLIFMPFAFAAGLVYFMASGKGVKPQDKAGKEEKKEEDRGGEGPGM